MGICINDNIPCVQRWPRFFCYSKNLCMKLPLVTLSFLAFLLNFTACTKSAKSLRSTGDEQLGAGDWNLVSDSTFEGVAQNNHAVDYTGQLGDYFSFTTDGHVYTREGGVLDTLTYKMG